MTPERFIAERLRFKGKMAVAATAISFLVIIIAVTVSSGFRSEIRRGLSEMYGDIVLEGDTVSASDSLLAVISQTPGVRSASPAIWRAGIVKKGRDILGVMVKGVPGRDSSLQVGIPSKLASAMNLAEGESFQTYFVEERMKIRRFTIREIYDTPVETDEGLVVLAPLEDMARLNGWQGSRASCIEVRLEAEKPTADGLAFMAGTLSDRSGLSATPVRERFSQLYNWLDLLDFNVIVILALMSAVAGFNMISGLYILLFRNISTIGILKSLGMADKAIAGVFLRVAARIIAAGMLIGNALALLFCLIQGTTRILPLNPENYFLSYVPVRVNVPFILAADAASFCLIMLLMLIPTLFIAKVDPARSARAE